MSKAETLLEITEMIANTQLVSPSGFYKLRGISFDNYDIITARKLLADCETLTQESQS